MPSVKPERGCLAQQLGKKRNCAGTHPQAGVFNPPPADSAEVIFTQRRKHNGPGFLKLDDSEKKPRQQRDARRLILPTDARLLLLGTQMPTSRQFPAHAHRHNIHPGVGLQHVGRKTEHDQRADQDLSLPGKHQTPNCFTAKKEALMDLVLFCCIWSEVSSSRTGTGWVVRVSFRLCSSGQGDLPFSMRIADEAEFVPF